MRTHFYTFVVFFLALSCSENIQQNEKTNLSLCRKFYEENKKNSFDVFYGTIIEPRGVELSKTKWRKALVHNVGLYHKDSSTYTNIPVYNTIADWKHFIDSVDAPYIKIYEDVRGKDKASSTLKCFAFVAQVMEKYYQTKVDSPYYYMGIMKVKSDPSLGKLIEFHLTGESHLYYVPDLNQLKNSHWINYLRQMPKFDNSWYYCTGKNCR